MHVRAALPRAADRLPQRFLREATGNDGFPLARPCRINPALGKRWGGNNTPLPFSSGNRSRHLRGLCCSVPRGRGQRGFTARPRPSHPRSEVAAAEAAGRGRRGVVCPLLLEAVVCVCGGVRKQPPPHPGHAPTRVSRCHSRMLGGRPPIERLGPLGVISLPPTFLRHREMAEGTRGNRLPSPAAGTREQIAPSRGSGTPHPPQRRLDPHVSGRGPAALPGRGGHGHTRFPRGEAPPVSGGFASGAGGKPPGGARRWQDDR